MELAKRCATIAPSATLAMTARAQALRASGRPIVAMTAGEPDFDTPEHIKQAAWQAIQRGETKYTAVAGTPALREAVAHNYQALYGIPLLPQQILVGNGGKQILFQAIATAIDPGDEVLFAAPYWVSYPDMIQLFGGIAKPVWHHQQPGALPLAHDFAQATTPATKLLILNSPSNPTGAMYTSAQLADIKAYLLAHPNIAIITDDIYAGLVYDGTFTSLLHHAPELAARTMIASGVSKTFAMTGWRIGFGAGPQHWIKAMETMQGASTSNACSVAQAAALAALQGPQEPILAMCQRFHQRRDRIVGLLANIQHVSFIHPQGAFYIFLHIAHYLTPNMSNSMALSEYLLERQHLALVPGEAFGSQEHIRLSFAMDEQHIEQGVQRLQQGLETLR